MVRPEAAQASADAAREPLCDGIRIAEGCSVWSERGLVGAAERPADLLRDIFAARPARTLRALPDRAAFVWPADAGVVVKRYERGALADGWHDVLQRGGARSAGRREAENLRELASAGLPVPRALGWCEERGAWPALRARRSALWMERVEHAETLRQLAERDPDAASARWGAELARLLARLHSLGWYHRDAYLEHWILAGDRLVLLDAGRARRERAPRERWFVKDVAALLHSCPAGVGPRARLRFLARYLDLRGLGGRAERRDFARQVLSKARRIAAHAPRFVDRTSRP